jgi:hypothetical protein
VAARQRALESELEQLHRANASALAKLETEQRAAAESMRSAGQALQAVIDRRVDAEAFGAADHEVSCRMAAAACGKACACACCHHLRLIDRLIDRLIYLD